MSAAPHPDYAAYPDHPLHSCPAHWIEAARKSVGKAEEWNDVAPADVNPIADAVVMAVVQAMKEGPGE